MSTSETKPRYPWAELYDVESGATRIHTGQASLGPGRPRKAVARIKTSITLTDEEKRIYEKLAYELGSRLHPIKVTKGQVIGLALRLLDEKTKNLPDSMENWEAIAAELFEDDQNG